MSVIKKFSNHFKEITKFTKINPTALNHSEPSYRAYGENTKGVDADHIKIFKINMDNSFAFAFYNTIGEHSEHPYFVVTYKNAVTGIVSTIYKQDSFKEKINQFISILKVLSESGTLNDKTLEKTFRSNFIKATEENIEIKKDVDTAIATVESISIKYDAQREKGILKKSRLEKSLATGESDITKQVSDLQKELGFEEIEKQYKSCVEKINSKKRALEEKHKIKTIKKELEDIRYEQSSLKSREENEVSQALKKFPKVIRDRALEQKGKTVSN